MKRLFSGPILRADRPFWSSIFLQRLSSAQVCFILRTHTELVHVHPVFGFLSQSVSYEEDSGRKEGRMILFGNDHQASTRKGRWRQL